MKKEEIKQFIVEILEEHNNFPITQFSEISIFRGETNIIDSEQDSYILTGVCQEFSEALFELQEEELVSAIEVDNVDYLSLNEIIYDTSSSDEKIYYD